MQPLIPGAANGVATDATSVYWTMNAGTVMKCSAADCKGTVVTFASKQVYPGPVAVDSTRVYWANSGSNGAVLSCPIDGGAVTTLAAVTLAGPVGSVTSMAVDDKNLYWTNGVAVFKYPKDGSGGPALLVPASSPAGVGLVTTDGTDVYWWNAKSQLCECPATGCNGGTPVVLTTGQGGPLTVDATDIYWTTSFNESPSTLMRCSKQDCAGTVVPLASGKYTWMGITTDESGVYWLDGEYGSVLKCPKTGCSGGPLRLASGGPFSGQGAIALGASNVYWTSMAGLMSVPK